ncbi:hypothetical protein AMAG_01048 [Allomyces macrogynus ATCC 38327]|uniref:Bromo domain-containing protein n=1 Tax=Allomyces macrogynus (strain ATCC 38327) TaxID=578462 RepID=A0A0L0RXL7_ALLM3|nr:hypothetical protein AMAG_01048 [Allomyces macrogynus ATCC 38327]|eukprot:KNE55117.1 hypothetical protein AMAG_01048 [Allomyces macrogynus ATCC 38327]
MAATGAAPAATTVDTVVTVPPSTSTTTTAREPWQTQDYLLLLAAVQRSGGLPVRNWHHVQQLLHSCPLASTRLRAAGPKTLEWHCQQFMHDQQPFGTPLSLDVALQVLYAKRFRELYNSIQSEDDVLREELRKLYPPPSTPGSSATPALSSTPVPDAAPDSVPPPLPIAAPSRDAPSAARRGSTGPVSSPTRAPAGDSAPGSAADQPADAATTRAEDCSPDADAPMAVDSPPPSSDAVDEPMDVDTSPVTNPTSTTAAAPAPSPAVPSPASPVIDGICTPPAATTTSDANTPAPPTTAATDVSAPATHPLTQVMDMDVGTDADTAPSSEHSSELAIALPDSDAHAIALPDPTPTSPSAFPPWAGARRGSRVVVESSASADGGGEGAEEDGEDGNDESSEVISLDVEFSDTMSEARGGGAVVPARVKDEDAEDGEDAVVAAAARALRETTAGSDVTMGEATSSSEPVSRTASVDATTSAPPPTAAPAAPPARRGRRASLKQGDDKYKAWRRLCLHKWDDIASLRLGNTFQSHGGRRDTDLGETYRTVIKQPMDLKTIRQRVRDGSVHATDEFHRDLLLMLANTCMYFPPGSDWHAMALEMKGEVEVQMGQFRSVEAAAAARVAGGAHGGSPALSAGAGAGVEKPDARPVLGRRDVSPSPLPEPMVVSTSGADGDEGEGGFAVKTEMG